MSLKEIPDIRQLLDIAPVKHNDRVFIKYLQNGAVVEKRFSEVRQDSLAFCRRLRHVFPKKVHIAIISKSCYAYIVCLTGCIISGNVAVPVPPDITVADAAAILTDADVTAVLYEHAFADKIDALRQACPAITAAMDLGETAEFDALLASYGDGSPYAELSEIPVDGEACSLIIYTSGTTGDRKGVMLSQKALVRNMMFDVKRKDLTEPGVLLSVLPLYHIFCFVCDYVGPLILGHTVCLSAGMRELFPNMLRFQPTSMRVVPMIAQAMLARIRAVEHQHPELSPLEAAARVTGGKLKIMFAGGAYLDPALAETFETYGIFLRQGYGMSEFASKITMPDEDTDIRGVGRVLPFVDVRIQDGEIQARTPCIMLGYYNRPEETKAAFTEDGWMKTGDIGYLTEDRQLYVTGRVKNLIILSNGENVSPEGIEKKYKAYPLVEEVLVYAEKDTIVAEIYPNAAYAANAGIADIPAALEEITDEINMNAMPSHTVARTVTRSEPLEKTAMGKIIRKK